MALNISLPKELENMIHEKVNMGLYQNPSEVVRDALNEFFSKPTEGEVYAYFVDKRLREIEDSGEDFVEADLLELKQLRCEIDKNTSNNK